MLARRARSLATFFRTACGRRHGVPVGNFAVNSARPRADHQGRNPGTEAPIPQPRETLRRRPGDARGLGWTGVAALALALSAGCRSWSVIEEDEEVRFHGRRITVESGPRGEMIREEEALTARFFRLDDSGFLVVESTPPQVAPGHPPARGFQILEFDRERRITIAEGDPGPIAIPLPPTALARAVPEDLHPHLGVPRRPDSSPRIVSRDEIISRIDRKRVEGGDHPLTRFPAGTLFAQSLQRIGQGPSARWELHRTVADPLPLSEVGTTGKILEFEEIFVLSPREDAVVGYRRSVLRELPTSQGITRRREAVELERQLRRGLGPTEKESLARQLAEVRTARQLLTTNPETASARLRALLSRRQESPLLDIARLYQSSIWRTRQLRQDREHQERMARLLGGEHVEPAPSLRGIDLDGRPISIADMKGSVILLSFWTSWCMLCRSEVPHIAALRERYAATGLEVVAVNREQNPKFARRFARSYLRYRTLFGMWQAFQDYDVDSLPCLILIDAQGQIRYRRNGSTDAVAREEIEDAVIYLLDEAQSILDRAKTAADPPGSTPVDKGEE